MGGVVVGAEGRKKKSGTRFRIPLSPPLDIRSTMKCARDRPRTSIVSAVEEEVKGDFGNFFVRDGFDFSVSMRYAAAICSRRKAVVKAGGA